LPVIQADSAARLPVVAAPSLAARLARGRDSEGAPQFLAAVGIVGDDIAAHAELTAGAATITLPSTTSGINVMY